MVDGAVRNDELESIIDADPQDPVGWLIYGDWLQSEGDPRGELVAVQARLARDPGNPQLMAEQRVLFKKNAHILLAGLDDYLTLEPEPLLRLSWEFGYIWTANVRARGHTLAQFTAGLRALLMHPSARFLHALTVGTPPDEVNGWAATLEILRVHAPSSVRMLFVGTTDMEERLPRPAFGAVGDLSVLWPRLPNLEVVSLSGGTMHVGTMDLPKLKELIVETSALQREVPIALGSRPRPTLERLELWFGERRCTCMLADLAPIFEGSQFPALTKVAFRNCAFVDRICNAFREAPIGKQLHTIDLTLGVMTGMGAAALVEAKPNLSRLVVLNVDWNNNDEDARDAMSELRAVARVVSFGSFASWRSDREVRRSPRVWVDT